jgi:hypothetical protein
MDRSVDASSAQQAVVGSVDDHVDLYGMFE